MRVGGGREEREREEEGRGREGADTSKNEFSPRKSMFELTASKRRSRSRLGPFPPPSY